MSCVTKLLFPGAKVSRYQQSSIRGVSVLTLLFVLQNFHFATEACLFFVITNAPQRFCRHLIFRPCLAEPRKNSRLLKYFAQQPILLFSSRSHNFFFFPPSLASQFFRIRQTTNRALCISSFWQALKVLTNDSLIQRKTGGGEGETDKNNRLPQPWGA